MKIRYLLLSLVVIFYSNLKAQEISAFPFLNLNPDPQSLAIGWGGAANVSSDPMGYYFNPALLGYYSQKTNLSYQIYAGVPDWMPALTTVKMYTNSFTVGYKYESPFNNLNISAGFGYSRYKIDYGNYIPFGNNDFIGVVNDYDKYDAYTLGLSVDYFVNLSFGMSFKNINSRMMEFSPRLTIRDYKANTTDWGLLLTVPVLKLIDENLAFETGSTELRPFVNFALGYSRLNKGNEINYSYLNQKEPLPLTAHLGYNLSFGTDIDLFENSFRLVDVNLMVDASDNLFSYEHFMGATIINYKKGLGDIDITENLLKWRATDNTILRKGRSLTLLETVSLLGGSVHGQNYSEGVSTSGVAISSNGIFKILSSVIYDNDPRIKYILNHLELKYVRATTFEDTEMISKVSSLSVSLRDISF